MGLAIENPFSNIHLPSPTEDAKKRIPISTMDLKLIQTECMKIDDDLRWLIAIISDTGMRLAEAAGLKIDDLVIDDEIPHVVIQPHNHRPLKTRSSERAVPLVGCITLGSSENQTECYWRILFSTLYNCR